MGIKERRKREKERRRRQIQDAAKEIFFSKGFAAATMEEIAQKQELVVSTFNVPIVPVYVTAELALTAEIIALSCFVAWVSK